MGFLDSLFGSGPEVNTQTLDTLTPEQQRALNSLLFQLSGADPRQFEGDVTVDPSNLERLSLAGLEERAMALSDPNRDSELLNVATDMVTRLMDFESADAGIDDFFRTNVQQPLLESFSEDILPQIGRTFGGSNFFGSERAEADDTAREELLGSLTRSRESLAFNAREADRNRALQAIGLAPSLAESERGDSRELLDIFGAGERATGLEERNVTREFERFISEAGLEDRSIEQLLAGINTRALENVVTVTPGSSGLLGGFLSGGGAGGLLDLFKDKPKPKTSSSSTVVGG